MTVAELLAPLPPTSGMSGDVNLFFHDKEGGSLDRAEIECMVAEEGSRRKGLGSDSLRMLMLYAAERLGVKVYEARVGDANAPSRAMFSSLGYTEVSHSDDWNETTYELHMNEEVVEKLKQSLGDAFVQVPVANSSETAAAAAAD